MGGPSLSADWLHDQAGTASTCDAAASSRALRNWAVDTVVVLESSLLNSMLGSPFQLRRTQLRTAVEAFCEEDKSSQDENGPLALTEVRQHVAARCCPDSEHAVYACAAFDRTSTPIPFGAIVDEYWPQPPLVTSVTVPELHALFEPLQDPILSVGNVVEIAVTFPGSDEISSMLVWITELNHPGSATGNLLALGRGVALYRMADLQRVATAAGVALPTARLQDYSDDPRLVMLTYHRMSFTAYNIVQIYPALHHWLWRDASSLPSDELYFKDVLEINWMLLHPVDIRTAPGATYSYMLFERRMYGTRGPQWGRYRHTLADHVYHACLDALSLGISRRHPLEVEVSINREWFLLLPLTALQRLRVEEPVQNHRAHGKRGAAAASAQHAADGETPQYAVFTTTLNTVEEVEVVMSGMDEDCRQQSLDQETDYCVHHQVKRGGAPVDVYCHIMCPVRLSYAPANPERTDTMSITFHAMKVSQGEVEWDTKAAAAAEE